MADEQVDANDASLLPENPQEGSRRRESPFSSRNWTQRTDRVQHQDHQHRDNPEQFDVGVSFFLHSKPWVELNGLCFRCALVFLLIKEG